MKPSHFIKRHGNIVGLILITAAALISFVIYLNYIGIALENISQLGQIKDSLTLDVNKTRYQKIISDIEKRRAEKPVPSTFNPFF